MVVIKHEMEHVWIAKLHLPVAVTFGPSWARDGAVVSTCMHLPVAVRAEVECGGQLERCWVASREEV